MNHDRSELNKLDTVARSLAIEARLRALRWLVIAFAAFISLLAIISEAPLYETARFGRWRLLAWRWRQSLKRIS